MSNFGVAVELTNLFSLPTGGMVAMTGITSVKTLETSKELDS